MNERGDDVNIPREPWQRLLEDSAEGPPETTDARIRAAARRDLAPRGQRWWIPASLAASFVLAVLIVRSEIGTGGRVPVTTNARDGDAAIDGRIIERHEGEQAREPGQSPTAPAPRRAKQREATESDAYGHADSELGEEAAGTGPLIGGPERDLKAASEMPEERIQLDAPAPPVAAAAASGSPPAAPPAAPVISGRAAKAEAPLDSIAVTGARPQAEAAPSSWTPTHVAAPVDNVPPQAGSAEKAPSALIATPPTPEAWYAAIEKLRREGKAAEADRELGRLKKAYPGWLEAHLGTQKPR